MRCVFCKKAPTGDQPMLGPFGDDRSTYAHQLCPTWSRGGYERPNYDLVGVEEVSSHNMLWYY